jgi:hypothetical protein
MMYSPLRMEKSLEFEIQDLKFENGELEFGAALPALSLSNVSC